MSFDKVKDLARRLKRAGLNGEWRVHNSHIEEFAKMVGGKPKDGRMVDAHGNLWVLMMDMHWEKRKSGGRYGKKG